MSAPLVVTAKTGNYTLDASFDCGGTFTNRGAGGSVTFTLPTAAQITSGWYADFFCVAAQTVIVAAGTVDTMIVFGDATADSISWATGGQIIGSGCRVVYDGTGWLTFLYPGTTSGAQTAATVTIAT